MNINKSIKEVKAKVRRETKRIKDKGLGVAVGAGALIAAQTATVRPASAEINETTFQPIVNLIDAVIPLFTSILDLIIGVFPLIIAMAFLGGLAVLIDGIFKKSLNFGGKK